MNTAETTTRELTTMVQQLLKSNINMSRRLKNIERMHPAMNPSTCPSRTMSLRTGDIRWLNETQRLSENHYEKELETSLVYKRPVFSRLRASQGSFNAASGPSSFSGLSLSDVSHVTAMALPISSSELWNHYRYTTKNGLDTKLDGSNLDAWYYPPPKVRSSSLSAPAMTNMDQEECFHQDCLLRRPLHQPVCASQIHWPSDISAV